MAIEIQFTESFFDQLQRSPARVQKKFKSEREGLLRTKPDSHTPPRIKKLRGFDNHYRLRLHDYRLIYRVKGSVVTLFMLGHRSTVYDQYGYDPDKEQPAARIVADEASHVLLEIKPTRDEAVRALETVLNEPPPPQPAGNDNERLPEVFTTELLKDLGFSGENLKRLSLCKTEGDLLTKASNDDLGAIMPALWPSTIEEVLNEPVHELPQPSAPESALDEEATLESFLLALDDTQKALTRRFLDDNPKGPWIVKGGPGSGKSTVALYCIRNLLQTSQSMLPNQTRPLRILFTTFTRSLVHASSQLLSALNVNPAHGEVDVLNIDNLVMRHAGSQTPRRIQPGKGPANEIMKAALDSCATSGSKFSFTLGDMDFLFEELDWVISGNGLSTLEEYLEFERTGSGRRLGPVQRRHMWDLHQAMMKELSKHKVCLASHQYLSAIKNLVPLYDYVFIDEAQDLKPIAIRMCVKLTKGSRNVFITADRNQSIYGSGFLWKRVSEHLVFTGKSTILKRNYRTTHEITNAIRPLLASEEETDTETFNDEPVHHGLAPELRFMDADHSELAILTLWLTKALLECRVGHSCAAVVCPRNKDCTRIAEGLPARFRAVAMLGGAMDLSHKGVKVLTMHSAKGLQFPVVAVTGLTKGRMPWTAWSGIDQGEMDKRLRRLFYVACSRAVKRLLVIGDRHNPSPFLEDLKDTYWDIE